MKPKPTLWSREPHTEGKHLVLKEYLKAWFPILGSTQGRIIFIDGFAGPGEYTGGEPGSPVIAMEAFANHSAAHRITAQVFLAFIENRPDRAKHLQSLVSQREPGFPNNMKAYVINQDFDPTMTKILADLKEGHQRLAPAFVMIDPFGVKDFSMDVIRGILSNPKCEVYITIMWSRISRFGLTPEFKPYMDDIFGSGWTSVNDIASINGRNELYRMYKQRLKTSDARYVLSFDLYKGKQIEYSIFFATQNLTGCDRMKKAIWKVSPFGGFSFRGRVADQPILVGLDAPDYDPLQSALLDQFNGGEWTRIEDVLDFVKSDKTIYHSGQVKTPALRPMEEKGFLHVKPGSRDNRLTYPQGCLIRFGESGQHSLFSKPLAGSGSGLDPGNGVGKGVPKVQRH